MKVLYIGQCEIGSTSRMRYNVINSLSDSEAQLIDTSQSINRVNKLFNSIGWRFNLGPLIWKVNKSITQFLLKDKNDFDVIWIDKGVFIYSSVLLKLKSRTKLLVHYTPDTAFLGNYSRYFVSSMHLYDFLITTKSFELEFYLKYVEKSKIILIPQGYDPKVHYPRCDFSQKNNSITFIGLHEPYREEVLISLLESGFYIVLGGVGWRNFLKKYSSRINQITFLGDKVVNDQYAAAISTSKFALGLLSKKFPELHTTRTFEIPACGTCLITEENEEINSFFSVEECVKFRSTEDLIQRLNYIKTHPDLLESITLNGYHRNKKESRDYPSQISNVFQMILSKIQTLDTTNI